MLIRRYFVTAAALVLVVIGALTTAVTVTGQSQAPVTTPVGAVVAFALSPNQAKALSPDWLPADGRTVTDKKSPLNGKALPNLTGRVLLGADPAQDASVDVSTEGGSRDALKLTTGYMAYPSCQEDHLDEVRNYFPERIVAVWDVKNAQENGCQHKHDVVVESPSEPGKLPLPPYRGVIYMVKVR